MRNSHSPWSAWLLSPLGMLILVSISYAWLLADTDFALPHMTSDLAWLGAFCIMIGLRVVRYRFYSVAISRAFANRLLNVALICLTALAAFLLAVTGASINALVDERFAIPAYGLVYSLYFVCALVVGATWQKQNALWRRLAFFLLFAYVGFIAGGKGFLLPFIFGLSLGQLLGLNQIRHRWLAALLASAFFGAIYVVYTLVDDVQAVLLILQTRIALAADAVIWFSQMHVGEILEFPIPAWQIVADLFSRWVGIRVTPAAVGSVMARTVTGEDAGGGPNPLLPVMAYLVNHGEFALSIVFVLLMLAMLALFLFATGRWLSKIPDGLFFHAVLVFLSPLFIIDVFLYWQTVVCLFLLGFLCLSTKWFAKNHCTITANPLSRS